MGVGADADVVPIDPWLADRYAGVEPHRPDAQARTTPPAETRTARRRTDDLIRDLSRVARRRRRVRRLLWLGGLAVVAAAVLVYVLPMV